MEEAQKNNIRLLAEHYNIPIAEARIIQARLRPNPSLVLGLNYLDVFNIKLNPNTNNGGPSEFNGGIVYPWEWKGKRAGRIEVAEKTRAVVEADFLSTVRNLRFNTQSAFVDLLLSKLAYDLSVESQRSFDRIVSINKTRFETGDLARVEYIRSEVAALQFANQVRQAESRRRQARIRLQSLMGRTSFDPNFEVVGELETKVIPQTLDEILEVALRERPEVEHSRRDLQRSSADLKYQLALRRPDLNITTVFNRQYGYAYASTLGVTLEAPLPLFHRNQGEIERARKDYDQTALELRAIENEVRTEVQAAWEQYQAARALLERIETEMLDRARRVRETIDFSYRRGEATFVELLDAQRTFNETMQSYNEAKAEYARIRYYMDAIQAKGVRP